VAGNDTGLSPRFVVVSETDPLERLQFTPDSVRTLRTTIIKPSNQSDAVGTRNKPGGVAVGLSQCRDKLNIP
jgi:hypothetical protein